MKTRLSLALAFLLMVVQGLWAQTPMTPAGENTWTAPMPAYQILLHADYWGEFAISYDLDGGVNHAENPSLYYEDETVTLKTPTKENYIFTGWTGSNGNEPQLEVSITQGSTGDKSFVAHWNEIPTPDPQQDPTIFAGFTATAGCDGFGGEDHSKLVDGLFAPGNEGVDWTKWCADGQHKSVPSGESESCWWIDFNATNPIAVTGYILTTGNDNTQWGQGRNPNSWKIKAKLNENDPWTTIATVTNDNTMQVADFTDFTFDLDQAGTYKYFRFMVYEPEYDNCMQLCEFRFTGNGGSTPEPPTINELLQELWTALGEDVWTGYGVNTGVISYSRGGAEAFHASFMGGNYAFDLPFAAFTEASKAANTDGSYTYTLTCNLPAQTGMGQETLHVTLKNGEITELESENAGIEMNKEEEISGWVSLQNAFTQGGVIKLAADVADLNSEGALVVPAGKTVMLELNGHIINRALTSAVADGSVIVNNGTLAIMGEGQITGGKTTGNGGGVLNNGIFTLYGGEITGNVAAIGGGVYNNGGAQGFWMTGGLIKGNTATTSNPAIGGEVIFNNMAVVQIDAQGATVSIADAIAGLATYDYIKPVMPDYEDIPTEVAITANVDPENPTLYYSTFFDSANKYMLPAGVEAYVADLSGDDLVLTKIAGAGQVIPANEAVILKASVANFNLNPSFEAPVNVPTNNDLEGVDVATPLADLGIEKEQCYVLSGSTQYGVGFYKINATMLKAHKAYVIYNGSLNNAPRRMRFVFENEQIATGVDNTEATVESQKIMENGVLYIIKNGVKYNVQGQIVK